MIVTLLSLVLLLLLAPLLWAFWPPFGPFLDAVFTLDKFQWVGAGFAVCFLLGLAVHGVVATFIEVVVHEMTHALIGIPIRGWPSEIKASSQEGGETVWINPAIRGCLVGSLAPYCFPLLTALLLPIRLLSAIEAIPSNYAIAFEAALRFLPWARATAAQLQGIGL